MPAKIHPIETADPRLLEGKYRVDPSTGCWLWTRSIQSNGYGQLQVNGRRVTAHRFSYTARHGPVDTAMELDHLCRTRACINPDHLEPVTRRVNWERGDSPLRKHAEQTHCKRGHPLTPENIYTPPAILARGGTRRECRACKYDPSTVHRHYLAKPSRKPKTGRRVTS